MTDNTAAQPDLHAQIMNLPCPSILPPEFASFEYSERWLMEKAYKIGHGDACHAAAELVGATLSAPDRELLAGWRIEPTQLDEELSIVPPLEMKDGSLIQPQGICVASWSTCPDSRILYALAAALRARLQEGAK